MLSNSLFFLRSIALLCISSVVFGATPAIGIVTAAGHFMIEKSQVWGNSSLFDGSTIQTDQASSDLALRNGVKVQLGAKSRAQIFEKRLALEKGTGQVNAASAYEVDAAGLKITGERVDCTTPIAVPATLSAPTCARTGLFKDSDVVASGGA